jgi:hypothetical protein
MLAMHNCVDGLQACKHVAATVCNNSKGGVEGAAVACVCSHACLAAVQHCGISLFFFV